MGMTVLPSSKSELIPTTVTSSFDASSPPTTYVVHSSDDEDTSQLTSKRHHSAASESSLETKPTLFIPISSPSGSVITRTSCPISPAGLSMGKPPLPTSPHPSLKHPSHLLKRNSLFSLQTSHRATSPSTTPTELFGSFVGSYEESILSGRMSSNPSKPIVFNMEIGVIGSIKTPSPDTPSDIKKHKPLKCPPHLYTSFPAYFYNWMDSECPTTPYVGSVDLNSCDSDTVLESIGHLEDRGYRIPPTGRLQIIIKNPSKTAVKLFLIPYDFSDMPPNSKTFLRQKSYSTASPNRSAPTLSPSLNSPGSSDRLRYAIHLQFRSSSRRKIYLTGLMRVVFSPRAPELDEKLKVVCQGPVDPKYVPVSEAIRWDDSPVASTRTKDGKASRRNKAGLKLNMSAVASSDSQDATFVGVDEMMLKMMGVDLSLKSPVAHCGPGSTPYPLDTCQRTLKSEESLNLLASGLDANGDVEDSCKNNTALRR